MADKKRYITAGVTVAAAAVTAHLMQYSSTTDPDSAAAAVSAAAIASPAAVAPPGAILPTRNEVTIVTPPPEGFAPNEKKVVILAPGLAPDSKALSEDAAQVITPLFFKEEVQPNVKRTRPKPDPESDIVTMPTDAAADGDMSSPDLMAEPTEPEDFSGELTPLGFPAPPREATAPEPLPVVGIELPRRLSSSSDTPVAATTEQEPRSQFGMACGPIMSAAPLSDALVNLIMVAPCRPNARFELSHGALAFTAQTDKLGSFEITVPALAKEALFSVAFEDGEDVSASASVLDIDGLDRVAVVAPASAGFELHALEFGATYGDKGHIWADNPGDPGVAATEGTGYLMRLGATDLEDATLAEVYTFPSQSSDATGVVRLSVETEVTATNCGTDAVGQTLSLEPGGVASAVGVTVSVPGCAAIGQYLVLKNVLRDLRIASSN